MGALQRMYYLVDFDWEDCTHAHTRICYRPIANRWPACKRADPIVSRSAGYSETGSGPLWFESGPGAAIANHTVLAHGCGRPRLRFRSNAEKEERYRCTVRSPNGHYS